ncbi:MAG: hypothetical protein CM15mP4_1470 [Candidatus Neomarinimicrobiota bacterium]|nr:MAG: hypothetical protein CM15mP4_1470 [Candidatus Neomarinimicrobiota bacterium]
MELFTLVDNTVKMMSLPHHELLLGTLQKV